MLNIRFMMSNNIFYEQSIRLFISFKLALSSYGLEKEKEKIQNITIKQVEYKQKLIHVICIQNITHTHKLFQAFHYHHKTN